jgi:pyruvate dehydrogenase E1 component alpha subunit
MGFMDKAKQLAEQAQQKLDETQKNFNKSNSPESPPQGDAVKYDEHGRPIQDAPPAGATAPPAAEPAAAPAPDPTAPLEGAPAAAEPTQEQPAADAPPPPPKPASGDANASPDPFKPIQ